MQRLDNRIAVVSGAARAVIPKMKATLTQGKPWLAMADDMCFR